MNPEILAEPILVGREPELDELQQALKATLNGKGTTIFVSGEAGSGKTRLTNEFLTYAKDNGITILAGWCLSNAAVPYLPFVEALESYSSPNQETSKPNNQQLEAETWLKGPGNNQKMSPQAWKDQTFSAVTKELLYLSASRPVILFIDDLHWADSASLSMLHYISRSIISERILVIATFRTEEVKPFVEGGNKLSETLRIMGREGLFKEIHLGPLSQANVCSIAENMLGSKVKLSFIQTLTVESQGIPLFIIESLRMLYEQEALLKENGEWQLNVDKFNIPSKVKDIILRRVESLTHDQKRILEVAATIGEVFDPKLVAAVVSKDSLDVIESLNTIAESTLLVHFEGDSYKFDHAKSREMLYEQIPLPLRREYHLRIAKKIENSKCPSELKVNDLAYHYVKSGNEKKSILYSLAAGKNALARFSNTEAINHFTYVHQKSQENKNSPDNMTALEGLGDALYANMMFKEAAKTFEDLAKLGGTSPLRALRKAMEASFFQDDIPHLTNLIRKAEACGSLDKLENARILHNKGRVLVLQGQQVLAVENFEKANQIFEQEYSLWDTAWDLIALGNNLPTKGQLERALAAILRAIAIFQELGDSRWLVEAYNMAGLICVAYFGFWQEGISFFEKASRINEDEKIGDYLRLAHLNGEWAWIHIAMGDVKSAVSKSMISLSYSEKTDSSWAKGLAYSNLAMYHTILGELTLAEHYFGKLMELPPEVRLNPVLNTSMTTAVFFAGKNQWEDSMKVFNAMFAHFKQNPNPGVEAIVKRSYAWALGHQGLIEESKKQLEEVQQFYHEVKERFEQFNILSNIMTPVKVVSDQVFEARLDLVNISRGHGLLVRIENMVPQELMVISLSKDGRIQGDSFEVKDSRLEPLGVVSIKFSLKATKAGEFTLNPRIVYVSESGITKTSKPKPVSIHVSVPYNSGTERAFQIESVKAEFKSETSRKAFDFLTRAYNEDYLQKKLPLDRSGWRTLNEIVKLGQVSKYSMYGMSGRSGEAKAELEHLGLVESRFFCGERGRGGRILKLRICCEKQK